MRTKTIVCAGLSHKTAPVALRERFGCTQSDLDAAAHGRFAALSERVILSTCNRYELYVVVDGEVDDPAGLVAEFMSALSGQPRAVLARYGYTLTGDTAVDHLMRTAAGLESLVLGEPQILGQVTGAYMTAVAAHSAGPVLTAVFQSAIRAGKRARTETGISNNPASLSSIAVAQAQELVGDLSERRVLLVGLGEMGQLALKALRARGIERIAIANRTRARAEAAVAAWGGRAYGLDELATAVAAADVIICATGAPHVLIGRDLVAAGLNGRSADKVFLDLAVPRDVDPAVASLPHVHVRDVDQLQASLDAALAERRQAVPQVEQILAEETAVLDALLRELTVKPLIAGMRRKAEEIRQRELERTLRHLGPVDDATLAQIQRLSRSLINKILHEPTLRIKEQATLGETAYIAAACDLFGLETCEEEWNLEIRHRDSV